MDSFGRNSIIRDTNEELIHVRHVAVEWKMTNIYLNKAQKL